MACQVKVGWLVERLFSYVESLQDLAPCLILLGNGETGVFVFSRLLHQHRE